MENNDDKLSVLSEISGIYCKVMKEIEEEQEKYWNSLSKEDQLKVFCAVCRRIFKGDIELKGSYRYVLYQVFGFEADAYAQAQDAGYLAIHNAIFTSDQEERLLANFAKFHGLPEDAVSRYYKETH
jgi:hypothetical protein